MEDNQKQPPVDQAETEVHYRSIIEVMRDGIIVQATNGQILDCNAEAGNIFGLPVNEITARTFLKPQWEPIHENGQPFDVLQHPALVSLQTGQPVSDVIIRVTRNDRKQIWRESVLCGPDNHQLYGVQNARYRQGKIYQRLWTTGKSRGQRGHSLGHS